MRLLTINGTLRTSVWLQHLSPGYIARCFQYAHEADPAALLFYNDYQATNTVRRNLGPLIVY